MMTLKESYHYQNYLDELMRRCVALLNDKSFVMKTTEVHDKKKANPDAENETIVFQASDNYEYDAEKVLCFAEKLIVEKKKLTRAISDAKRTIDFDIDAEMALNKITQSFVRTLKTMSDRKGSEKQNYAYAHRWNVEGNQVSYQYPVIIKEEINFNRNDVRNMSKHFKKECDEISAKKDLVELTTEVNYHPIFEVDTDFDEVMAEIFIK